MDEILYTWVLTPQQISPGPSEGKEKYNEVCGAFKGHLRSHNLEPKLRATSSACVPVTEQSFHLCPKAHHGMWHFETTLEAVGAE